MLTDFDGTLAPIVDDPATSRPLPEAVDVLHGLAARYRRVAVVSGRPAGFLASHLALHGRPDGAGEAGEGLVAVGLYGLERAEDGRVRADDRAACWAPVVDRLAEVARREAPPGLGVEHKGVSLTLHYRTAPQLGEWARAWAADQAAATGLVLHAARMSEELRPPVEVDKGTAVAELSEGLAAVCFVGDDVGDVPAFTTLDRLADRGVAVLKAAVRSDESPPELLERADVVVDGPEGAVALLSRLLDVPTS
ncbi:MAG: trehalose-phosphatase [Actinomycetota bacterium]|nr:trehalose-phosphatase [Actinomycetota bacterium]